MKTKNIYADPTIDFAFKRIFGTERFKAATIGLLNSIIKDVNIVDVSFLNTEIIPENKDDKKCVIAFLNFASEAVTGISGRYELHYYTIDKASGHRLPASPEYHFFDLNAFKKSSKGITNETDYWLSLLTGSKEMDGMPDWAKGNKAYEAFFEASTRANFTPEETFQYEKDMMTERDRINSINYARWEGVQEGKAEGRQQTQREIAAAFKAKGIDVETISSCTGLSVEEVNVL